MGTTGKIFDAIPFGLAAAALYGSPTHGQVAGTEPEPEPGPVPGPGPVSGAGELFVARVRAEERYLGRTSPDVEALQAFGLASESLVTRWADNGHAIQAAALCERAEAILAELASTDEGRQSLAGRSRVLEAGLDARFTTLADALGAVLAELERRGPAQEALARAEEALLTVRKHGRKRDRDAEIRAATDAVRLARWLAAPEDPPRPWPTAPPGCCAPGPGPTVPSPQSSAPTRAGCPRSPTLRPPVIVVLDGMIAAAGIELAGELAGRGGWLEAGRREDGREPVLATVPSVTAISRTSC